MSYVNVGASNMRGQRFATKKALKEALTQDPSSVMFDGTSTFDPFYGPATQAPAGVKLQVCGPDPYTQRKWYATVTVTGGNVKVS